MPTIYQPSVSPSGRIETTFTSDQFGGGAAEGLAQVAGAVEGAAIQVRKRQVAEYQLQAELDSLKKEKEVALAYRRETNAIDPQDPDFIRKVEAARVKAVDTFGRGSESVLTDDSKDIAYRDAYSVNLRKLGGKYDARLTMNEDALVAGRDDLIMGRWEREAVEQSVTSPQLLPRKVIELKHLFNRIKETGRHPDFRVDAKYKQAVGRITKATYSNFAKQDPVGFAKSVMGVDVAPVDSVPILGGTGDFDDTTVNFQIDPSGYDPVGHSLFGQMTELDRARVTKLAKDSYMQALNARVDSVKFKENERRVAEDKYFRGGTTRADSLFVRKDVVGLQKLLIQVGNDSTAEESVLDAPSATALKNYIKSAIGSAASGGGRGGSGGDLKNATYFKVLSRLNRGEPVTPRELISLGIEGKLTPAQVTSLTKASGDIPRALRIKSAASVVSQIMEAYKTTGSPQAGVAESTKFTSELMDALVALQQGNPNATFAEMEELGLRIGQKYTSRTLAQRLQDSQKLFISGSDKLFNSDTILNSATGVGGVESSDPGKKPSLLDALR